MIPLPVSGLAKEEGCILTGIVVSFYKSVDCNIEEIPTILSLTKVESCVR